MRGGWRGAMGTVGGITRTYGLHNHFTRPGMDGLQPPRLSRAGIRRILGYFIPYRRLWIQVVACIIIRAGLNVLPPFCVALILDRAIPERDTRLLLLLAGAMVALAAVSGLVSVLQQTLTARTGQGIMNDLRTQLFRHLQRMSLGFYSSSRPGEIVSRINNDVNAVQGVVTGTLVEIVDNAATLTATSIALFSRNWRLALLALAVVPAFYLPSKIVGRIRRRLSAQALESQASLLGFLQERLHVSGSLLTMIFGQREADARGFSARSERVRDLNIRQAVVGRWLFTILSVFSAMGPALIYGYGGYQAMHDTLTPGLLVAFAALLTLLYRPVVQLATVYVDIQAAVAVFDRLFEYLDLKPDVTVRPDCHRPASTTGHIAFEHVGFSYPPPPALWSATPAGPEKADADEVPRKGFALLDVSFEIGPGERVALVGPSGSGKTTLTYLLPRCFDPTHGRITLDGHDLRDLEPEALRRHIGMVTQETFLFHTTIRENLLYARPEATEDEIRSACKAANIHDFIANLPDGYETVVGERGFRLSGGEKQRVSIARALLKNPSILILDEATSSLDATSEHLVQEALEILLRGRTSLAIAHRLSTILHSDKIVALQGGRVIETGRHAELLARGGLYAELFSKQFGKARDMLEGRT